MVVVKTCRYLLRYKTSVEKWDGIAHILENMGEEKLARLAREVRDYINERGDIALPMWEEVEATIMELSDIPYLSDENHPCPHCLAFHDKAAEEGGDTCSYCFLHQPNCACCEPWDRFRKEILRRLNE